MLNFYTTFNLLFLNHKIKALVVVCAVISPVEFPLSLYLNLAGHKCAVAFMPRIIRFNASKVLCSVGDDRAVYFILDDTVLCLCRNNPIVIQDCYYQYSYFSFSHCLPPSLEAPFIYKYNIVLQSITWLNRLNSSEFLTGPRLHVFLVWII